MLKELLFPQGGGRGRGEAPSPSPGRGRGRGEAPSDPSPSAGRGRGGPVDEGGPSGDLSTQLGGLGVGSNSSIYKPSNYRDPDKDTSGKIVDIYTSIG